MSENGDARARVGRRFARIADWARRVDARGPTASGNVAVDLRVLLGFADGLADAGLLGHGVVIEVLAVALHPGECSGIGSVLRAALGLHCIAEIDGHGGRPHQHGR